LREVRAVDLIHGSALVFYTATPGSARAKAPSSGPREVPRGTPSLGPAPRAPARPRWLQELPDRFKAAPDARKNARRWPKETQDGLGHAHDAPKRPPETRRERFQRQNVWIFYSFSLFLAFPSFSASDIPRRLQGAPRSLQGGPRGSQEGPKMAQGDPRRFQDGPKTVPQGPQGRSRGPQTASEAPKTAPVSPRKLRAGLGEPQESPKTAQESPKTGYERPEIVQKGS